MRHFLQQTPEQFQAWTVAQGQPAYRAAQVWHWLLEKRATEFQAMSNLPRAWREALAAEFQLWTTRIATHRRADDCTQKLLL